MDGKERGHVQRRARDAEMVEMRQRTVTLTERIRERSVMMIECLDERTLSPLFMMIFSRLWSSIAKLWAETLGLTRFWKMEI
ncbi:hypothetical protein L484_013268 [Morus notabilis]|uniref:Uncharacterized protein n=1 Tax=Morus notabilis TaxID=981085 RepID=W9SES4_9ROSA|nr:hypothetical protein L484_013268 [Morus notabilis]